MCTTYVASLCPLALIANLVHPITSGCGTSFEGTLVIFCIGRLDARKVIHKVLEPTSILFFERESSQTLRLNKMVRLRMEARKARADKLLEESMVMTARTGEGMREPITPTSLPQSENPFPSYTEVVVSEAGPSNCLPSQLNLVAVMGTDPPVGSQEPLVPQTPNSINYTWQETSPVNGRASGIFILHLGPTPQTSPMSRDPPNLVVNRKQLREALRVKQIRGRKGQSGVRRRLEDAMEVRPTRMTRKQSFQGGSSTGHDEQPQRRARMGRQDTVPASEPPLDWVAPPIMVRPRSPILLRKRLQIANHGTVVPPVEEDAKTDITVAKEDFRPTVEAFSWSLHHEGVSTLDYFSDTTRNIPDITELTENLSPPPTVTEVDALVPSDETVRNFCFTQPYTFTVYVPSLEDAANIGSASNVPVIEDDSENDPDWQAEYADFVSEDASQRSNSDDGANSYNEEPLVELGLYDSEEDVSTWPFERIWSDNQWQDQSTTLLQNTNNFSGPVPGPTSPVVDEPSEYFLRYWPPELMNRVVAETNRYAAQPCQLNLAVTNGRDDWIALDSEELLAWFGILILMGLKEVPHMRCYWDRRPFFNCPLISETMPRNRFEAIVRCLHLVDNETVVTDRENPAYDKLAKVRWLCESFARMSQELYHNERVLTVDEIMVPYKGRFCNIRQYMKAKPVKFGVKIWALANSESRYISNIIVYLGADNIRTEGDSVGEDAVLNAVVGLEGRGHVIITDNFFTSPRLFMELLRRGFWATGTVRKNRKGFPPSLAGFLNGQLPERGHLVIKMHRSRQIVAICWMDSKPVFLLSTACNPIGNNSFAGRWVGRERIQFQTSPILLQYQSGMRGVDLVDQQRQEYTTQLHSHKWWHRIFMFVLDSQLLNSYILYACDRRALGVPLLSRSLWHYRLAEFLIRPRMQPGHIRGPMRNLAGGGLHYSASEGGARRRCVVCSRRTRHMCPGCGGLFQCEGACYRAVHTQGAYAENRRDLA